MSRFLIVSAVLAESEISGEKNGGGLAIF